MKYSPEQMQKMRDVSIVELHGISQTGRRVRVPCQIHGGRNDNLEIAPDNKFHCFKCGAGGKGAIDFYMSFEGTELGEVLEELSKHI